MPVPATDPNEILFGAGSHPTHRSEHARLVTFGDTDTAQGLNTILYPNATPAYNTTYSNIGTVTAAVRTGRLYRFAMHWRAINTSFGGHSYVNIRSNYTPSAVAGTSDLIIDANVWMLGNSSYTSMNYDQTFRANATGTISFILQIWGQAGNIWLGGLYGNGGAFIEEIGPDRGRQTGTP